MRELARVLSYRFGHNPRQYVAGTLHLLCPPDFSDDIWSILRSIQHHTMTSPERVSALVEAVQFIVHNQIPGSIVECGVWRGGSMMAVALALKKAGDASRELHLFDTFEGMPKPSAADVDLNGRSAGGFFRKHQTGPDTSNFCRATMEEVRLAMNSTGYDESQVHLVKGRVEETIPKHAPDSIALLRLDTDWYESTKHELEHLFPRLSKHGVLIIDDYGHWEGARKAVDEYFAENKISILLSRVDYTGRVAVKLEEAPC
jgi:O-methyltransferase